MQPSAIENGPYDYTRSGNPTRDALERFDKDVIGFVLGCNYDVSYYVSLSILF